jgi:hypothetical protein
MDAETISQTENAKMSRVVRRIAAAVMEEAGYLDSETLTPGVDFAIPTWDQIYAAARHGKAALAIAVANDAFDVRDMEMRVLEDCVRCPDLGYGLPESYQDHAARVRADA